MGKRKHCKPQICHRKPGASVTGKGMRSASRNTARSKLAEQLQPGLSRSLWATTSWCRQGCEWGEREAVSSSGHQDQDEDAACWREIREKQPAWLMGWRDWLMRKDESAPRSWGRGPTGADENRLQVCEMDKHPAGSSWLHQGGEDEGSIRERGWGSQKGHQETHGSSRDDRWAQDSSGLLEGEAPWKGYPGVTLSGSPDALPCRALQLALGSEG